MSCTKNGSYCENEKNQGGWGGGGGGVRGMCTKNGSYCEKEKKNKETKRYRHMGWVGGRVGEAFVKIQIYIYIFFFWGGGGVGGM